MQIDKSKPYSDVLEVGNVLTVTPNSNSSVLVTIGTVKYPVTSATSFGPYLLGVKFNIDVSAGSASVVESSSTANQLVSASPGSSVFVKNIWCGTQAQYDAIAVKDANTQYNTDAGIYIGETLVSGGGGGSVVGQSAGATIAFMFDDGYASNFQYALPIFKKYGMAATIAVEVDKIGQNYNSNPAYPVCTPSQLRELIENGWEVTNHPNLTNGHTEAQMVAGMRTENQLLLDYLTGAKVVPNAAGNVTHPQYADYPIDTAVLRGGWRDAAADLACRFLFDKVRSINGALALRGDYLSVFSTYAERQMGCSAFSVDTSATSLETSLAFIESVAQTNGTAILYAHDTPTAYIGSGTPYILAAELDEMLKRCYDLGVRVVPLRKLYRGNAIADKTFNKATGTFSARAGDTADFVTTNTLNGAARAVRLVSSAGVASDGTSYSPPSFIVDPFCRYRVTIRYLIETDLSLIGGSGNRNHGLSLILRTSTSNTAAEGSSVHYDRMRVLNDAVSRVPYLATAGQYATYSCVLVSGYGGHAELSASLFSCVGEVLIGAIYVEKLDSLIASPLSGSATFDSHLGRSIYLPNPAASTSRNWKWELSAFAPVLASGETFNFAFSNSASVPPPAAGNTCYVLSSASGSFAGHEGERATYNGSTWDFSAINAAHCFKVLNFQGQANVYVRHYTVRVDGSIKIPYYDQSITAVFDDPAIIDAANNKVFSKSGKRVDAFTWVARPIADGG